MEYHEYRYYDPIAHRLCISRQVTFFENILYFVSSSQVLAQDISFLFDLGPSPLTIILGFPLTESSPAPSPLPPKPSSPLWPLIIHVYSRRPLETRDVSVPLADNVGES